MRAVFFIPVLNRFSIIEQIARESIEWSECRAIQHFVHSIFYSISYSPNCKSSFVLCALIDICRRVMSSILSLSPVFIAAFICLHETKLLRVFFVNKTTCIEKGALKKIATTNSTPFTLPNCSTNHKIKCKLRGWDTNWSATNHFVRFGMWDNEENR